MHHVIFALHGGGLLVVEVLGAIVVSWWYLQSTRSAVITIVILFVTRAFVVFSPYIIQGPSMFRKDKNE